MEISYINKKLAACQVHLILRGIEYEPPLRDVDGAEDALFSFQLSGSLGMFDIAFLESGMTALRQVDPDDESRMILFEQAIPEFIVDIVSDLKAGYSCSHIQRHL
jgi:hypothetical protein